MGTEIECLRSLDKMGNLVTIFTLSSSTVLKQGDN